MFDLSFIIPSTFGTQPPILGPNASIGGLGLRFKLQMLFLDQWSMNASQALIDFGQTLLQMYPVAKCVL
jgi:hypothetical protein